MVTLPRTCPCHHQWKWKLSFPTTFGSVGMGLWTGSLFPGFFGLKIEGQKEVARIFFPDVKRDFSNFYSQDVLGGPPLKSWFKPIQSHLVMFFLLFFSPDFLLKHFRKNFFLWISSSYYHNASGFIDGHLSKFYQDPKSTDDTWFYQFQ